MSPHRRQKKDLNIYIYNTPSLFAFLLLLLRSANQAHLDLALFLKPARISSATAPKPKETDQKRPKSFIQPRGSTTPEKHLRWACAPAAQRERAAVWQEGRNNATPPLGNRAAATSSSALSRFIF